MCDSSCHTVSQNFHFCCFIAVACIQGCHFSATSGNLEMSGTENSAKARGKSAKRHKVRERPGNLCSQGYLNWHNASDVHGHVIRTSYNLPVLYAYFNAFRISDIQCFALTLVSR